MSETTEQRFKNIQILANPELHAIGSSEAEMVTAFGAIEDEATAALPLVRREAAVVEAALAFRASGLGMNAYPEDMVVAKRALFRALDALAESEEA